MQYRNSSIFNRLFIRKSNEVILNHRIYDLEIKVGSIMSDYCIDEDMCCIDTIKAWCLLRAILIFRIKFIIINHLQAAATNIMD